MDLTHFDKRGWKESIPPVVPGFTLPEKEKLGKPVIFCKDCVGPEVEVWNRAQMRCEGIGYDNA